MRTSAVRPKCTVLHLHLAQPKQLDEEDRAVYKGRIITMLQPGETVLQALRRLANMQKQRQQQQQQQHPGRRKKGGQRQWGNLLGRDHGAGRGGEGGEEEDDDDDSPSDSLFTLQQQGRSGERQRLKKLAKQQMEQAQGQRQQQEGQAQEPAPANTPSTGGTDGSTTAPACSAALAFSSAVAAASESGRSGQMPGSSPATSTQTPRPPPSQRLDRRVPVENSIEFDKLTGYADLLLGQVKGEWVSQPAELKFKEGGLQSVCLPSMDLVCSAFQPQAHQLGPWL